jgi:hypothetical protein
LHILVINLHQLFSCSVVQLFSHQHPKIIMATNHSKDDTNINININNKDITPTSLLLEEIIGISPFGIYCRPCKTKIASSTFRNHIRDVHSDHHNPKTVNYTAVSRELERLVQQQKRNCDNFEEYLIPNETSCERFQCTSCQCLFDSRGNGKRHFLSMKTGCSDGASLEVVKCRKTICYRAVTLTDLERLIDEAKNRPPEPAVEGQQQQQQEKEPAAETPPKKKSSSSSSSSSRKRPPPQSSTTKKIGKAKKLPARDPEPEDDTKPNTITPKLYRPPPGVRSSARMRSKQTTTEN